MQCKFATGAIPHTTVENFGYFRVYVCWEQTKMKQHAPCMETSLLSAFAHILHVLIEL